MSSYSNEIIEDFASGSYKNQLRKNERQPLPVALIVSAVMALVVSILIFAYLGHQGFFKDRLNLSDFSIFKNRSMISLKKGNAGDAALMNRMYISSLVVEASKSHRVEPELIYAVIMTESNFNMNAKSRVGALGLMQLMPRTAKALGVMNPLDPRQNIQGGTKYLSSLIRKYDGQLSLALAAYNAGPGAVAKHRGIPPYAETKNYVRKVLKIYNTQKNLRIV